MGSDRVLTQEFIGKEGREAQEAAEKAAENNGPDKEKKPAVQPLPGHSV